MSKLVKKEGAAKGSTNTNQSLPTSAGTANVLLIEPAKLISAGEIFKVVSHPLRLKILAIINEKQEVNVNVIYNTLKIEQSITSQHLKMMRGIDLVQTRRDGKKIYYKINAACFSKINKAVEAFKF